MLEQDESRSESINSTNSSGGMWFFRSVDDSLPELVGGTAGR